jgi:hypothetical protein
VTCLPRLEPPSFSALFALHKTGTDPVGAPLGGRLTVSFKHTYQPPSAPCRWGFLWPSAITSVAINAETRINTGFLRCLLEPSNHRTITRQDLATFSALVRPPNRPSRAPQSVPHFNKMTTLDEAGGTLFHGGKFPVIRPLPHDSEISENDPQKLDERNAILR